MRSFGFASNLIFSFNRFSSRALISWPIRSGMVMKYTLAPCRIASTPNAMARCVLPTPGGPSSTRFSFCSMNRRLEAEVELVESLQIREVGPLRLQLYIAVILCLALTLQQSFQKIQIRKILRRGLFGDAGIAL